MLSKNPPDINKAVDRVKPIEPGMQVHIEIHREDKHGDLDIRADITNQEDLTAFYEKSAEYMPRKKWLGIL